MGSACTRIHMDLIALDLTGRAIFNIKIVFDPPAPSPSTRVRTNAKNPAELPTPIILSRVSAAEMELIAPIHTNVKKLIRIKLSKNVLKPSFGKLSAITNLKATAVKSNVKIIDIRSAKSTTGITKAEKQRNTLRAPRPERGQTKQ
jgi:hypothetical protein